MSDLSTKAVVDKYDAGEELTTDENIVLLTYIIGMQADQIASQGRNMKLYDRAINELQAAVTQLQIKHQCLEAGETESGIIIQT
ncbi:coil containing protein [Vibrio phage 1.081.O._10N.286.52.C2]|nr:coil containing protein [Vibrio phage 1.081.O._10N.286.52.C2]